MSPPPVHRLVWFGAFCVITYVAIGFGLWEPREQTTFALQANRVCVRSTRTELALRHDWIAHSRLRTPLTVVYLPLNALRRPGSP